MTTLVERALRSAAEDLGLSPDGWRPAEDYPDNRHVFRHRDKPSLLIEVRVDNQAWSWSTGNSGGGSRLRTTPGDTQYWACIHGLLVRECADARVALLEALAIAGDNVKEASACSTVMLHSRLETLRCRRGVDVFVAPVEHVATTAEEPAQPLRLTWSYRGTTPDGGDVAGEVTAADEASAQLLAEKRHASLKLTSLQPNLAGLRPLLVTPARINLERSLSSLPVTSERSNTAPD